MAVVNRSARFPSKHVFIVVILVVTVFFPLLVLFTSPSGNTRPTPAALPFQSSTFEADGVGRVQISDSRRITLPDPVCDCKCKLKKESEEEASAVIQSQKTEERSKAFEEIFTTDFWGGGESRSGPGSRIDYTANVRKLIAHALKEYHVGHVLDAPCGDVNWQPFIEGFNITRYTGYDIVPQIIQQNKERFRDWPNMDFGRVDFVNTPITINPDLILCRDGIQHNTLQDGLRGFCNLEASGAKYLVTNWHTETGRGFLPDNAINFNIQFGGAYPINVFTHPFNFSMPEFLISEGVDGINGDGKLAGVWKLPVLWKGDGKRFQVPGSLSERVRREVISKADVEAALRTV